MSPAVQRHRVNGCAVAAALDLDEGAAAVAFRVAEVSARARHSLGPTSDELGGEVTLPMAGDGDVVVFERPALGVVSGVAHGRFCCGPSPQRK